MTFSSTPKALNIKERQKRQKIAPKANWNPAIIMEKVYNEPHIGATPEFKHIQAKSSLTQKMTLKRPND